MNAHPFIRSYFQTAVWPMARALLELLKLRVATLLTIVAVATAFVAADGAPHTDHHR